MQPREPEALQPQAGLSGVKGHDMGTKRMVLGAIGVVLVAGWPLGVARLPVGPSVALARQAAAPAPQPEEGDPMIREMMVLSISRESAGVYADLMGLDELQREVVMEMHREYLASYRDAAVIMRDARVAIEEKMAGGGAELEDIEATMRGMMRVMLGFLDRVMTLGQQYPPALGALPAAEQPRAGHQRGVLAREREMAVAMSTMEGGSDGGLIDLIALGRTMDPPLVPAEDAGPAAEAMLAYERELGALCGPFIQRAIAAFREMAEDFGMDPEAGGSNEQLEAQMEAMVQRFQAINERTVRRVHAALPPERQSAWDLAYKRARWPQVYAANGFHRTHDAAMALPDLAGEQRETIDATMAQYTREADPANQKWIDAMAQAEAARNQMRTEWSDQLWTAFQKLDQAAKDAQAARQALDDRFADRILKSLTPQQREAMPDEQAGIDADAVLRELGGR